VVAVAETLGFHKAAERCHVSQPTLSAQVKQLEDVLGVQLFERDRRRVLLTAAGAVVVAHARRVLLEIDDMIAAAKQLIEPCSGTFRIGVIPTIAPYLLPDVVPAVRARYPKLQLVFREEKTDALVADLREGRLDAGLLALEADIGEWASGRIAGRRPIARSHSSGARTHPSRRRSATSRRYFGRPFGDRDDRPRIGSAPFERHPSQTSAEARMNSGRSRRRARSSRNLPAVDGSERGASGRALQRTHDRCRPVRPCDDRCRFW
jgi:DNA-binding transcriptional LysR family regulator